MVFMIAIRIYIKPADTVLELGHLCIFSKILEMVLMLEMDVSLAQN